jgi:hypothetical protein
MASMDTGESYRGRGRGRGGRGGYPPRNDGWYGGGGGGGGGRGTAYGSGGRAPYNSNDGGGGRGRGGYTQNFSQNGRGRGRGYFGNQGECVLVPSIVVSWASLSLNEATCTVQIGSKRAHLRAKFDVQAGVGGEAGRGLLTPRQRRSASRPPPTWSLWLSSRATAAR